MTKYNIRCIHCGELKIVELNPEDIAKYANGALAQDAFPYLSADDRELIISRTCTRCWDEIFQEA
jgi:hypothetical protein